MCYKIISDSRDLENIMVSVIIPVFNSENTVLKTIQSVLDQSYKRLEIIMIDDGSSDNSLELILNEVCTKSIPNILLLHSQCNNGVAKARNLAIGEARGKFVAFLDADDLWERKKLENQIHFMESMKCDFSYTSYSVIDNDDAVVSTVKAEEGITSKKMLLSGNPIGLSTVMIRAYDVLQVTDVLFPDVHHEDYAAWLNLSNENIIMYSMSESLTRYRKAKDNRSLSSNKIKAAIWTFKVLKNYGRLRGTSLVVSFCRYAVKSIKKRKKEHL